MFTCLVALMRFALSCLPDRRHRFPVRLVSNKPSMMIGDAEREIIAFVASPVALRSTACLVPTVRGILRSWPSPVRRSVESHPAPGAAHF
jgi:hypothetical protein